MSSHGQHDLDSEHTPQCDVKPQCDYDCSLLYNANGIDLRVLPEVLLTWIDSSVKTQPHRVTVRKERSRCSSESVLQNEAMLVIRELSRSEPIIQRRRFKVTL